MDKNLQVYILLIVSQFLLIHVCQSLPIDDLEHSSPPIALNQDETKTDAAISYRLPNNTKPEHYYIKLKTEVHRGKTEFNGTNIITLKATEDTKNITIHGRQITIVSAKLKSKTTGKYLNLTNKIPMEPEKDNEFLTFYPEKELKKNEVYYLTIEYKGKLREDNGGFYLSKYTTEDGKVIPLATTQFESTDARHGFPCYDEPGIKAKFEIEITHGDNYTALSNMPTIIPIPADDPGFVITKFETTEKMSPYLVAFVISDFTNNSKLDKKRRPHGLYSRPGTEHYREFPLNSSISILEKIEEYVQVDYSFPKMDQISIPDFAAGAMENWGLVTYREEMLLYNETNSTTRTQTVVANTIAHEYGHQWFGNLVSPKWWTYLWLNEGFASLFAYIGVEEAYPKWDIMEHFIVAEYQRALKSDEGINKRAMTSYVEKPKEIAGIFDSVSYSKGACVIQMLRNYLGEKAFKAGLKHYLTKMKYDAAEEEDLFTSFQIGAKQENVPVLYTISEIMRSWTNQGGFPLLNVTRNYDNGSFTITQDGFKADTDDETKEDKRKWYIPFNYVSRDHNNFENTTVVHIFNDKNITIQPSKDEEFSKDSWLILNKKLSGYYRVNYDKKNWELIIKQLKEDPKKIHKYNRAQLILDSFRFSLNLKNTEQIQIFFDLMEYLEKETDYAPWASADEAFSFYKNHFHDNTEIYSNLQVFILKNVEKIYKNLGITDKKDDRHFDKYIRTIAINWACTAQSESCLKETNDRLKDLVNNNKTIEPNLQNVIYCNGLKQHDDKEFEYLRDLLIKSNDQAERQILINSLGCTHKEEFLMEYAKFSIHDTKLREQEKINVLKSIYSKSKEGFKVVVDFLKENFEKYAKIKPSFTKTEPLDDAVKGLSKLVVSDDQKKMMTELVNKVKTHGSVDKNLEKIVNENMKLSLEWIEKSKSSVKKQLDDFKKRNSATQFLVSSTAFFIVLVVSFKNLF